MSHFWEQGQQLPKYQDYLIVTMTKLQHTTQITAIVVLLYITEAVVSRPNPIVTKSESPTYTSQLIGEELRKQYVALQKQNEPVKVLIEMLVQVSGKYKIAVIFSFIRNSSRQRVDGAFACTM